MERKQIGPARLGIIFILIAAVIGVYALRLYDMQILNGAAYYEESRNSIVTESEIEASRGEITDRYGRVLATNRASYNIQINSSELLDLDDPNAYILELVALAVEYEGGYTDSLPITAAPTFVYESDATAAEQSNLSAYLAYFDLEEDISAAELMIFLRDRYAVSPDLGGEEARMVVGIRYELELRSIVNMDPYVFVEDASTDFITVLLEQGYPAVSVVTTSVREYTTEYAAHVLGRIGPLYEDEVEEYLAAGYELDDLVGKYGIERLYESQLRGVNGVQTTTTSASGVVTEVLETEEAQPGNNVVLTLDIELQAVAENALDTWIDQLNADRDADEDLSTGGAVVAMDVDTGEVLVCASYPDYDVSAVNRALSGTYAPGSTFKPLVALAALEEGVIGEYDTIYDEGIYTEYTGYQPTCWIYPGSHGDEDVRSAIRDSCNYYFYVVGTSLTINRIAAYAKAFGLGQSTGIELDEEQGVLATPAYKLETEGIDWYVGDTLQAAIGQLYNSFTPLQMAAYASTLANGGIRYAATILRGIYTHDYSQPVEENQPEVLNTVEADQHYFDVVTEAMVEVTTQGATTYLFQDLPVTVAGKTGTAQTGNTTNDGVFICFAPAEDPEIAVAVVVEKGGSGSAVAGIARDVLAAYFQTQGNWNTVDTENQLLP